MNKGILRTADEFFMGLPEYDFSPNYLYVDHPKYGDVRMHYIDEGQRDAPVILMLHGCPTWSYLYRKVVPLVVAAGFRAVVPDLIGFGQSDKLPERSDYSYQQYVSWMLSFIDQLGLQDILLLCQDWGGPIGLSSLAARPALFSSVVVTNTLLPNCELPPKGVEGWPGELIDNWVAFTVGAEDLPVGEIVNGVAVQPMEKAVKAAYDAPYPDSSYKAGALHFPSLIPRDESMPGIKENRWVWEQLEQWKKPFVTAFSDMDTTTKAWEKVFQSRIPGAKNREHYEIKNAGHFVQEEQAQRLAEICIAVAGGS